MSAEHTEQPLPVPNEHPSIQSLVRDDLDCRELLGIQRYGTSLQPHNGRDALRDAYEEALDLACYLKQSIVERDGADRPTDYALPARTPRGAGWEISAEQWRSLRVRQQSDRMSTFDAEPTLCQSRPPVWPEQQPFAREQSAAARYLAMLRLAALQELANTYNWGVPHPSEMQSSAVGLQQPLPPSVPLTFDYMQDLASAGMECIRRRYAPPYPYSWLPYPVECYSTKGAFE
jgi:hypothetical protein